MSENMQILLADPDPGTVRNIQEMCAQIPQVQAVRVCMNPVEIPEILEMDQPQAALLGPNLPPGEALRILGHVHLKGLPTACVLISDRREEAFEAFEENAADMMPAVFSVGRLERALNRAARLCGRRVQRHTVFVRTFGYFDVFVDGEAMYFSNAKAKELLAVLFDEEGGTVSMDTIIDRLWPERPYDENVKQLYRKAVGYLKKMLDSNGMTFFSSGRGWCSINRRQVNCDLFDVLEDKPHALDFYQGRYMFAYAWAEEREAVLDGMKRKASGVLNHPEEKK